MGQKAVYSRPQKTSQKNDTKGLCDERASLYCKESNYQRKNQVYRVILVQRNSFKIGSKTH
jgi:hypothetical protein